MSDHPRDPAWPPEVERQTDLEPSGWIAPRLLPWDAVVGSPVSMVVPTGYPAYVRVLHPASRPRELIPAVTWREVSDWSERTYHPIMQFERISVPRGLAQGPAPFNVPPRRGNMDEEICAVLYELLARWTTSTDIWLGIWEGWGTFGYPQSSSFFTGTDTDFGLTDLAARVQAAPRFEHPNRNYLLARAPVSAVAELSRFPLGITPSLAWPDDRAWCVATEIDFDSTLVAASEECAAALLVDDGLETLRVHPNDRLDIGGDVLNSE